MFFVSSSCDIRFLCKRLWHEHNTVLAAWCGRWLFLGCGNEVLDGDAVGLLFQLVCCRAHVLHFLLKVLYNSLGFFVVAHVDEVDADGH